MKLYMKQKIFSWADKFRVWDEREQEQYYIEGELFSWGKKLHVSDTEGRERVYIAEKVFSFLPRFYVYLDGEEAAEIVKEFTFFKPRYRIEGPDWSIQGDFWAHDYEITQREASIVRIHKAWMTWGDCYELDIRDPADELLALAVVLAIDCVIASQRSSHA